jgi:glycosyltransferase involved in cell wall biosynthesis
MAKAPQMMKLAIIGSRGIPASYGGFETFTEEISRRLIQKDIEVTVVCQRSESLLQEYKSVKLIYSKYSKADHPVRYYYDSLKLVKKNFDLVLVCGVGGAFFYPLLRRSNQVVITHVDGREELRGKYSEIKKLYVRMAQVFAAKYSDHLIADSFAIRDHWIRKFKVGGNRISAIEFGAETSGACDDSILSKMNLLPMEYFLVVCRMVPENNVEMILKGYLRSGSTRKLVLVGDTDGNYARALKKNTSEQIIFSDSIYVKPELFSLRKNCFAYIHGHSVGGTNPSLLEAMATGNICICHDNEFNQETTGNDQLYFNNEFSLAEQIRSVEKMDFAHRNKFSQSSVIRILNYYNWERISEEYFKLLHHLSTA